MTRSVHQRMNRSCKTIIILKEHTNYTDMQQQVFGKNNQLFNLRY